MTDGESSKPKRQRAIEQIVAANWDDLALRLGKRAAWRIRFVFRNLVGVDGSAPGGMAPDAFVNDAINKFLEPMRDEESSTAARNDAPRRATRGVRNWDPDEYNLFETLCFAIDSEIDTYAGKLWRRQKHDQVLQQEHAASRPALPLAWGPSAPLAAEVLLEYRDDRSEWLEKLEARPLAQAVARLMIDEEIEDPALLAASLGVTRETIYNEMKYLRRRVKAILRQRRG